MSKSEAQRRLAELLQKQKEQEAEHDNLLQKVQECENKITETKLEYARIYNASFPSILGFPVEVTALIFNQLYGHDERDEIAVSRVCQSWRTIALTSPELWSRFLYRISEETLRAGMMELNRLSVYLKRSGNHLLDLRFVVPMSLNNMTPTVVALLEKVKDHAARWRCFSLELIRGTSRDSWVHEKALDLVSGLVQISSQNLKLFEVILPASCRAQEDDSHQTWIPTSVVDWSNLCFGRMDVRSFARCLPPFCITTFQLVGQSGGYLLPLSWFSDFLSMANYTLVNLSIGADCLSNSSPPTRRGIAKALKNFHCGDKTLGRWIWSLLHAPLLEFLILEGILFYGIPPDGVQSDEFPATSFPALRSLALIDCKFASFDTMGSLADATKLASHIYISRGQTLTLILGLAPTILWPNMTTLTCSLPEATRHDDYQSYWNFYNFLDFIERQSKLVSHFTVQLSQEDAARWESEHLPSWEFLQASGWFEALLSSRETGGSIGILKHIPWPIPDSSMLW